MENLELDQELVEGTIMHEMSCLAGFVDPGTPVDKSSAGHGENL